MIKRSFPKILVVKNYTWTGETQSCAVDIKFSSLKKNFKKKSQYIISIELKEAFLGHADADDQLQHTNPDVDGAGAALV